MKRIAVTTKEGMISEHFGHSHQFTIFTLEGEKITNKEFFNTEKGCGCKTGVAVKLKDQDVTILLTGTMGKGALTKLMDVGIDVICGFSGSAEQAILSYVNGELPDQKLCKGHHQHH